MKVALAQRGAAIGGLPEHEFVDSAQVRLESLPYPYNDVFCGGILDEIVKRLMIERIDHVATNDIFNRVEVLNHPAGRPFAVKRSANCDFETIRMSVHAGTLARMVGENVGRFEAEMLANLHEGPA